MAPFAQHVKSVGAYEQKAFDGYPVLLRTYHSASVPVEYTIWEATRATSAVPTFFPPTKFRNPTGGGFIDGGIGCNNPTETLIKEAEVYHR